MIFKTRGIALSYIKYKDTSIIAKIFTEAFGLQSYIQNNVRNSNAKVKMALFQPLTLLDLVVYHKEKHDIHRISEIRCAYPYQSLQTDMRKVSVATFLTEILLKSVHQDDKNEDLFHFLYNSFITFDREEKNFENFHLQFLFGFMRYLGFHPHDAEEFTSQLANNSTRQLLGDERFNSAITGFIDSLTYENFHVDKEIRSILIDLIIEYFHLHIEKFGEIKSLRILREL